MLHLLCSRIFPKTFVFSLSFAFLSTWNIYFLLSWALQLKTKSLPAPLCSKSSTFIAIWGLSLVVSSFHNQKILDKMMMQVMTKIMMLVMIVIPQGLREGGWRGQFTQLRAAASSYYCCCCILLDNYYYGPRLLVGGPSGAQTHVKGTWHI